ncbi:DEAD/DEAH box helicase family protein [Sphingobium soli]|uniref:DEAD/DEAH box helicase family protein n=1 Tax=Sphingobium soli TaxID=1591116 RepID=A0ABS8H8G1_9SPHN|nr:type ISP restriction/modification enzyme [Sphingobium soli]MCC4234852.1 DEAD/DEAH box helicase family protein [Sphingobium soli]
MSSAIRDLLERYRSGAKSEREKGTYFERLCVEFLKHDPEMAQQYEDAWTFREWAETAGWKQTDTGIDLVAKLRDDGGFCAVQCKFYRADHHIQKSDIDSFFTASGKAPFTRRLIIDTTEVAWSKNAEDALDGQNISTTRISMERLEQSPIDWRTYLADDQIVLAPKKEVRQHQREALEAVREGLAEADRGKLIMACGTGKTFTGLKIAEDLAGPGKFVLFLVPSLALMSQTVREWSLDTTTPLRAFAVCSDAQVGKRNKGNDDIGDIDVHDLAHPATTDPAKLANKAKAPAPDEMTVVFSTYQSIQVISNAQKQHGFPEFDLIICDEAHRTTGATLEGEDESNFVRIHNQDFIAGKKRLYMTATPRIFGDAVRSKAKEVSAELCSMDDPALYGETLFQRGFGWAVQNDLLTDYKVIVLAVDEAMVSTSIQNRLKDEDNALKLDDATKIVGCYKALTKADLAADVATDTGHMRRALAFCKDIASSKLVRDEFSAVVEEYLASAASGDEEPPLGCEVHHVDGTFNAKTRTRELEWLKAEHEDHSCRILSNARCLSEGVDVPALDAIMFLHPRKSQIDVVQSVGRVMRRAPGKKMGYVILPVGIPAGVAPEEALNNNEKYKVVWQILNALRAHDERFDATINKMDLGVDVSGQIEVIAVSDKLPTKAKKKAGGIGIGQGGGSTDSGDRDGSSEPTGGEDQLAFSLDEFTTAIRAKIVKKCGRRDYWEDWAGDIAKIAQTHITRITAIVQQPGSTERAAFERFLTEIRDDLNESISENDAIEMLAQHLITRPVFEALFEGYSFTKNNPVSVAMEEVLTALDEQNLGKEAESLERFYASVRVRAAGIDNAAGKQKIVVELYDKFFRNAFPRMTERLGIVYTPVEVVDFIIHSVNEVLKAEFGQTLGSKGVHILDPFTGTGTFITRLLQSGLIEPEELAHKYQHEIHANEIVLLAYYIAAINIEAVYHSLSGGDYQPFEGICLTDTFQLYEQERDLISDLMPDNSNRRARQKALDIRVIIGNPPYSVGQDSDNRDAANLTYPVLDKRIQSTYVARSTGNPRSLYDSYIRAIRWASDRVGDAGVVGFVSNAGWLEGKAADGLRKCLVDEFANIFVFHLRGNQRTSGEKSRREGGKVFGSGSRTPVAITLLVKNPTAQSLGNIHFHDIGDYLSREEKLNKVAHFGSIAGISDAGEWQHIEPDQHGDWLGQRDSSFEAFPPVGAKRGGASFTIFENYSAGVKTNRDAWAYNASSALLSQNMRKMIDFYNESLSNPNRSDINDESKISWSWVLRERFAKGKQDYYKEGAITRSIYRPFSAQMLYYDGFFNENRYLTPSIFPDHSESNMAIYMTGPSAPNFSVLMIDAVPCLDVMSKGQCFPRYLFKLQTNKARSVQPELIDVDHSADSCERQDAITNAGLAYFQSAYPQEPITKDDLFYYTYGLLHSPDYRERYADNLSKELPRIPAVKGIESFRAFVAAGRKLGELHVGYESVEPYPISIAQGDLRLANIDDPESFYRVEQMRFAGKRPKLDKTTVIYNANITMTGIPLDAYAYVVNGKPALEWVMERQCVKTDKASGIVNDANRYAIETVGDPAYPLLLFQRVITVSLETMKIVRSLPPLGDLA